LSDGISTRRDAEKNNAAPTGAACQPQYALFRYFLLETGKSVECDSPAWGI
jgi:hypothetical protein